MAALGDIRPRVVAAVGTAARAREGSAATRGWASAAHWRQPRRPVVATPRVVAVVTGGLYTAAGLMVLAGSVLAPGELGSHVDLLRALAGTALALGSVVMWWGSHLPAWTSHVWVGAGTLLLTCAVALVGTGSPAGTGLACLYLFVAVDAAFFFAWPAALGHLVAAVAACVLVLTRPGGAGTVAALLMAGSMVLLAAVVAWLVQAAGTAETDSLTGLPNRRGLDRAVDAALAQAGATGRPLSAVVLDVDGFRQLNETRGHATGDRLLLGLASSWAGLLPTGAMLTRRGGDGFVVLLPGCTLTAAVTVAERLRGAAKAQSSDTTPACSVSAGVAQYDSSTPSTFITDADQALYEAKASGRDAVRSHTSAVAARLQVQRALDHDEVRVFHQPVVDLRSGTIVGTEALLRWAHPRRGLQGPAELLSLAESCGHLADVGRHVLDRAIAQTVSWQSVGGPATVAVNVAGPELLDPGYADFVSTVLARHGMPAGALVLEVTESSLDADTGPALDTLGRLRAAGVVIAVDDFGTGYSSLARLARLPVDILKIDQAFVRTIPPDSIAAPVVQAILALAAALGLEVIAEGVEQPHQAALLRALGCPQAQGHHFSAPVAPTELMDAVRSRGGSRPKHDLPLVATR